MNPVPAVNIETELLVIGYGNTLRGDDGVGPRDVLSAQRSRACGALSLDLDFKTKVLGNFLQAGGGHVRVSDARGTSGDGDNFDGREMDD